MITDTAVKREKEDTSEFDMICYWYTGNMDVEHVCRNDRDVYTND